MEAVAFEIVLILVLVVVNGLFAMSEMALVSARKVRLQQRAERGDAGAQAALDLIGEPSRFLSTVQIGITLVGILAGAFGGATLAEQLASRLEQIPPLAPYAEAVGVAIVVLVITFLSLIVGELVPKQVALVHAERIAALMARPMQLISRLASPAVFILSLTSTLILRLIGVRPTAESAVSEEEVKLLIDQGVTSGVFEQTEREMILGVLRLDDRGVKAIMTPRSDVVWLDSTLPADQVLRLLVDGRHARYPVGEGNLDRIKGVVRSRDVLSRYIADGRVDLLACLQPPAFIPEHLSTLEALDLLRGHGTDMGLIIDEYGGFDGLVTTQDMIEAIVGDLSEAGDMAEPPVVERSRGSWLIDGDVPIDEVEEIVGASLPGSRSGTFHTLAGFILNRLGHIPTIGEHFECEGIHFEIVDMDGFRIDRVALTQRVPDAGRAVPP